MKTTPLIILACVALAISGPVQRDVDIFWVDETATVTVTGAPAGPTGPWGHFGHWTFPWSRVFTRTAPGDSSPFAGSWSPDTTTAAGTIVITSSPSVSMSSVISPSTSSSTTASSSAAPSPSPSSGPASFYSSASSSAEPMATSLSSYAAAIIELHNVHRANHSAPDIVWDDNLTNIARDIANVCIYAHNVSAHGGGYGQNIGAGSPDAEAPSLINGMYNGEFNWYPSFGAEPSMSNFEHWGHLSQIVWVATTKVGCYTTHCPNGLANTSPGVAPYFTVCNYQPVGNVGGGYGKNVLRPLGNPTYNV